MTMDSTFTTKNLQMSSIGAEVNAIHVQMKRSALLNIVGFPDGSWTTGNDASPVFHQDKITPQQFIFRLLASDAHSQDIVQINSKS